MFLKYKYRMNKKLFDNKANEWDKKSIPKQLSESIGNALVKDITLNKGMHIMDFGAGTGLISSKIAPFVKKISAVDISQAMLDKLLEKIELQDKVEIFCQDIIYEPLNKKFDLIISAMAIHHVKQTPLLIKSFAKHLKSGATIALADLDLEDGSFHPEHSKGIFHFGFDRDYFKSLLENEGFENIKFITVDKVQKEQKEYSVFLVSAIKT